jgi:hypothetical protein
VDVGGEDALGLDEDGEGAVREAAEDGEEKGEAVHAEARCGYVLVCSGGEVASTVSVSDFKIYSSTKKEMGNGSNGG